MSSWPSSSRCSWGWLLRLLLLVCLRQLSATVVSALLPGQLPSTLTVVGLYSTGGTSLCATSGISDVSSGRWPDQNVSQFGLVSAKVSKFANSDYGNFQGLNQLWSGSASIADTVAIIHDGTTQSMNGVSYLAAFYEIPVISCSINSPNMQLQANLFPYFVSNYMPDFLQIDAFLSLAASYGWSHIAIFATMESTGVGYMAYLYTQMAAYPQLDINVFYLPYPDSGASFASAAAQQLQAMQNGEYYIGFLAMYKGSMITLINQAYQLGMVGPPYQWVGIGGICSSTGNLINQNVLSASEALGVLCLLESRPRAVMANAGLSSQFSGPITGGSSSLMAYTNFLQRFNGQSGIQVFQQLSSWADCYEAPYILAHALQNIVDLQLNYSGATLLQQIKNVSFLGPATASPISFNQQGVIDNSALDLMEYLPQTDGSYGAWSYVGSYYNQTKQWYITQQITFWSTTGNGAPLDYVPVWGDGAVLPFSYPATAGIVATLILLIALWTAGLTLRQAVLSKRRARVPPIASRLYSVTPLLVKVWPHWPSSAHLLISALIYSLAASISAHYAVFSLLTVPVFSVSFTNSSLASACVACFLLMYAALLLCQSEVEYHSIAARDLVNQSSTSRSGVSAGSGGSLNNVTTAFSGHSGHSAAATSSKQQQQQQKGAKLDKRLQAMSQLVFVRWAGEALKTLQSLSAVTVLAAALFTAAISVSFHVAMGGFVLPATASINVGLCIVSPLLVLFPASLYELHHAFHSLDTATAIKRLIVLAGAMALAVLIDSAAYTFHFSQSQYADQSSLYNSASSGVLSADNTLVLCSVLASLTVFMWLGLVMHVNRLSKGILDVLLLQAHKEGERCEMEWIKAKAQRLTTHEQLRRYQRFVALTAGARPLYREYAAAMEINLLQDSPILDSVCDALSPTHAADAAVARGTASGTTEYDTLSASPLPEGANRFRTFNKVLPAGPSPPRTVSGVNVHVASRTAAFSSPAASRTIAAASSRSSTPTGRHNSIPSTTHTATSKDRADPSTELVLSLFASFDSSDVLSRWALFASSALSSAVVASISTLDLLKHPVCLEMMKDTAVLAPGLKKGLIESITAWLDIQRYKESVDGQVRLALAREIINTFFVDSAPYPTHVSAAERKALLAHLAASKGAMAGTIATAAFSSSTSSSAGAPPMSLFSAVERECVERLRADLLPAMQESPSFHVCAVLLDRVNLWAESNA